NLEVRNGIVMTPMCQYSAKYCLPNDWHTKHYLSRAHDGGGIMIVEMMNVEPKTHYQRLPRHTVHVHALRYKLLPGADHKTGAKIGIQIAHAGRKAEDAEEPVSSSVIAYTDKYKEPHELTTEEAEEVIENYRLGARRTVSAHLIRHLPDDV